MIGNPTIGIQQMVEKGQIANEAKLLKQVEKPTFALDTDAQLQWRHFQSFCQTRGVRFLPAHPATVASFAFSENSFGVPSERIMSALEAIELNHDNAGLPNPIATSMVRAALGKVLNSSGASLARPGQIEVFHSANRGSSGDPAPREAEHTGNKAVST